MAATGVDDFVSGSDTTHCRKVLPPELCTTVARLTCDSSAYGGLCDVHLVGTCHGSSKSCQEVKAVIDFLKPQVVFLELCPCRGADQDPQGSINLEGLLDTEFAVAYEETRRYGAKVVLGDRIRHITDRRLQA